MRIRISGHFSNLGSFNAMLLQQTPGGVGAIGREFPITVVVGFGRMPGFRMAFQFKKKILWKSGDLPGECGKNPR